MREDPEVIQIKALITNDFIDSKIAELIKECDYDDMPTKKKGLLLNLLIRKHKVNFRAQA